MAVAVIATIATIWYSNANELWKHVWELKRNNKVLIIAWKIARNVYGNLKHSFCRLSLIKKQEKLLASSPSAGRLIKHHFLHIRSSLGTKFQPKLKFLNFRTKLTQKGYFQSKKKKKRKLPSKFTYSKF